MKTLIITGGNINKDFLKEYLLDYDNLIAVDGGLKTLYELNIIPNYIIGDFDTIDSNILNIYANNEKVKIYKYSAEKDCTDTDLAIKLATNLESTQIYIIGGIGSRIDHTLGNIHAILKATKKRY